jgi:hypothetical protein
VTVLGLTPGLGRWGKRSTALALVAPEDYHHQVRTIFNFHTPAPESGKLPFCDFFLSHPNMISSE